MDKKDFKLGIITLSDRAFEGVREDVSGPTILDYMEEKGFSRGEYVLIPDDGEKLKEALRFFAEQGFSLVLTTGGTGLAERDVTPEVTLSLADKVVPGIAEAIRAESLKITKHAMLSRGVAVVIKKTLVVNLPGSPKACRESLDVIIEALPHGLGLLAGEKLDK